MSVTLQSPSDAKVPGSTSTLVSISTVQHTSNDIDIAVDWNMNVWFSHSMLTGISTVAKKEDTLFVTEATCGADVLGSYRYGS